MQATGSTAPDDSANSPGLSARLRRALPICTWLPAYQRRWLAADLLAGITLAAFAVPVSLAYASLAGVAPQMGVYGFLFGSAYALFGTSRQISVGPSSSISLLIGSVIGGLVGGDPARAPALAAATALLVGGIAVFAWSFRLGHIVNFISESVLSGFKVGAALVIASTQLPALLGVSGATGELWSRLQHLVAHAGEANPPTLGLGLASIGLMLLGERWLRGWPVALLVVAGAIGLMNLVDPQQYGIAVVGPLAGGVPLPSLPDVHLSDLNALLPVALAAFLLSHVEGISVARTFALTHRYRIDVNQELLAIGAANVAVGLGHGYPVAGGMSQSAVNDEAGAKTPLSIVITAIVLGLVLVLFTDLFAALPQTVLAAVVLVSIKGLVDIGALRELRRVDRSEFRLAMVAVLGVLLFGILYGVVAAAIMSLLALIRRAEFPPMYELGRLPGTSRYRSRDYHPEAELERGVLVFRVDGSLVYFNAENVRAEMLRLLHNQTAPVSLLVFDMSGISEIDLAAVRMLASLHDELVKRGVHLELAEVRHTVRAAILAAGQQARFGTLDHRAEVAEIIDEMRPGLIEKSESSHQSR